MSDGLDLAQKSQSTTLAENARLYAELQREIARRVQAERAQRDSEERYRSLFNAVPIGLFRSTPDGKPLEANPAMMQMLGYPDRETLLAAGAPDSYVNPQDRERWQAIVEREGIVRDFEVQLYRRGGTVLWGRLDARAVRDGDGHIVYYEGSIKDITKYKRAEQALHESQERYRALFNQAQEAIVLEDENENIIDVNRAASQLFGYSREELLRMKTFDLKTPETQVEPQRTIYARPDQLEEQPFENEIMHRDGTIKPVEITITSIQVGEQRLFLSIIRDITERRQAETALQQLNEKLEQRVQERTSELQAEIVQRQRIEEELQQRHEELVTLNAIAMMLSQSLDLAHTLLTTLDIVQALSGADAGCIHLWNKEHKGLSLAVQRGFSQETVGDIQMIEVSASPSEVQENAICFEEIIRAGWQCLISVPLRFKNTTLGLMSLFNSLAVATTGVTPAPHSSEEPDAKLIQLLDAIGRQVAVAIENERLTKAAAEAKIVQEVDHLRSVLIGNVSHELRTPLGLIKATATTLLAKDVEFDQQTQQTLLQGIDQETDRLENIVNNLLDISRMEQRGLRLDCSSTDLGQLAGEIVEAMRVQVTQCQFVLDFPLDPLMAYVDARRVEQVLRNLLSNAVKYSPQGGTVIVKGRRQGNQLLISVSDQGIGIPPTDLDKVFERFYRVENETTLNVSGAGLGLAISQGIVEAHGGRIWAESDFGQGSTFHFTLLHSNSPPNGR